MPRLKVGIALDGVLADFIKEFVSLLNEMYGLPEEGALPTDWNLSNFGLSKEQIAATWQRTLNTKNFHLSLPRYSSTLDLKKLKSNKDFQLYFISTRLETVGLPADVQSIKWLQNKYEIDCPTVLLVGAKGPIAKALELDAFIDDKPETCLDVWEATNCRVYLQDRPWNRWFDPAPIVRVPSIDDFVDRILRDKDTLGLQKGLPKERIDE
jgi:uncharacterized HAD superfamily protein